jgi:hypothetical protein
MNDEQSKKFWDDLAKKSAQFTPPVTPEHIERIARERAEFANSAFNKRFPEYTYCETAFFRESGEIYLVRNTKDFVNGEVVRSHGERTYAPGDATYQEIFKRHKFNLRTDENHWIVTNGLEEIGDGWGDENE